MKYCIAPVRVDRLRNQDWKYYQGESRNLVCMPKSLLPSKSETIIQTAQHWARENVKESQATEFDVTARKPDTQLPTEENHK